jgi:hypothetical protein
VQANKSSKFDQLLNLPVSIFSARDSILLIRDEKAYPLLSQKFTKVDFTLSATTLTKGRYSLYLRSNIEG